MSVTKLGDTNSSISQRLRMLADEHDATDGDDRTEFLLVAMREDGAIESGGYIVDIAAAMGALEIAKIDLLESYYASLETMH